MENFKKKSVLFKISHLNFFYVKLKPEILCCFYLNSFWQKCFGFGKKSSFFGFVIMENFRQKTFATEIFVLVEFPCLVINVLTKESQSALAKTPGRKGLMREGAPCGRTIKMLLGTCTIFTLGVF